MKFSWDPAKARRNLAKHGISFENVMQVFDDAHLLVLEDCEDEYGEMRYQAIGTGRDRRLLVVVYVDRSEENEEITHIIAARKAVNYEEKAYARQFTQGD